MKPELSVVGIDLAKSLFHLVGLDERGKMIRSIYHCDTRSQG
jgi:hypothetical protein